MPFADDAWLAGFADGEASFGLYPSYGSSGRYYPRFIVQLRADDVGVLEQLRAEFGGKVRIHASVRPGQGNGKPKAAWTIIAKAELRGIVDYFDRFPLRAKKARDYAIWRRAVLAYIKDGTHSPELPPLYEALVAVRAYQDGEDTPMVPDTPPAEARA